jgi:hypothetical protein
LARAPDCIQFIFAFDRLKSLAHANPDLRRAEPLKVGRLDRALELARAAQDWTIVDMVADWNIVFPFQRDTAGTR